MEGLEAREQRTLDKIRSIPCGGPMPQAVHEAGLLYVAARAKATQVAQAQTFGGIFDAGAIEAHPAYQEYERALDALEAAADAEIDRVASGGLTYLEQQEQGER